MLLQTLKILDGIDLQALGHNTPAYIHTLVEALKLAFADRHAYYGDPKFVDVPIDALLSDAYAARRRALIDPAPRLSRNAAGRHRAELGIAAARPRRRRPIANTSRAIPTPPMSAPSIATATASPPRRATARSTGR